MATHRARWLIVVLVLAATACTTPALSPPAATSVPPADAPANPAADAPAAAQLAPITIEFAYAAVTAPYWHLFVGQEKGFYA